MPDLPWFAWVFAAVFWSLVLLRVRRRRSVDPSAVPAGDDGPRWSPTRGGGF